MGYLHLQIIKIISINMGKYWHLIYFGEPSDEPEHNEVELILPISMEKVPNNLFIVHFSDQLFFWNLS